MMKEFKLTIWVEYESKSIKGTSLQVLKSEIENVIMSICKENNLSGNLFVHMSTEYDDEFYDCDEFTIWVDGDYILYVN